jgi:hypothetical protein
MPPGDRTKPIVAVSKVVNIENNFRRIGSVNTDAVATVLAKLSGDSWERPAVDLQQPELYRDTSMVSLAYDFDFRHRNATQHAAMQVFGQVTRPILGVVADFFDQSRRGRELSESFGPGYFVRACFLALGPGGAIDLHSDQRFSELHSHRVHVPIVTNPQASVEVDAETLHIPAGEVYEISNTRPYAIRNAGDTSMIHLVLDYVRKGETCGDAECACVSAA